MGAQLVSGSDEPISEAPALHQRFLGLEKDQYRKLVKDQYRLRIL